LHVLASTPSFPSKNTRCAIIDGKTTYDIMQTICHYTVVIVSFIMTSIPFCISLTHQNVCKCLCHTCSNHNKQAIYILR